jgi:hypothetical protein
MSTTISGTVKSQNNKRLYVVEGRDLWSWLSQIEEDFHPRQIQPQSRQTMPKKKNNKKQGSLSRKTEKAA